MSYPTKSSASGVWSLSEVTMAVRGAIWPSAPGAPTSVSATAGNTQATVSFTAPADNGGYAITGYTVTSNPGGITATGSSSPITVTGLTNDTEYTFTVTAENILGNSEPSAASNAVTPIALQPGQQAFTTAGTYSWIAPTNVTSVSVVCVGGGGGGLRYSGAGGNGNYGSGGGGGALRYINNFAVTPGSSYTVVVGAKGRGGTTAGVTSGGQSYFNSTATVYANGGPKGTSSSFTAMATGGNGTGGGSGGYGTNSASSGGWEGGGGGAGGYSGNGGSAPYAGVAAVNATGGAGGGGFASGGGVGILGEGASGANNFNGGRGGSGGADGTTYAPNSSTSSNGGAYGGGGGCMDNSASGIVTGDPGSQNGGGGAVRIIWGPTTREFPSTNTGDL